MRAPDLLPLRNEPTAGAVNMDSAHLPRTAAKILVRSVNWLGDAVMTTPALLRLREAHPNAEIHILTPQKLADLWSQHPAVDAVITFAPQESLRTIAQNIRAKNFQSGLLLPNSPRSALELWLAGVPQRIGYAGPWRGWLLTQPVQRWPGSERMRKRSIIEIKRLIRRPPAPPPPPLPASAHHIHHYLRLIEVLGASADPLPPRLWVSETVIPSTPRSSARRA